MICYTIGHTNKTYDIFLNELMQSKINCIVDVRSTPYSKYVPQYDRERLKKFLNDNGILYIFMGDELGARRDDDSLYMDDGTIDFAKVCLTKEFNTGILRIVDGLSKGFTIGIMCTERFAIDCHRFLLVSRALKDKGIEVIHIDGHDLLMNQDVERKMVDLYFPNYNQVTIFNGLKDYSDILDSSYIKHNYAIGYRKDK